MMKSSLVFSFRCWLLVGSCACALPACGGHASESGERGSGAGGSGSGPSGTGAVSGLNEDGNNVKGYGGAEQNYQNGSFAGCTDPVPFIPDADTGYYSCSEPIIWRQEALECPNNLPPNEAVEFPDYVTSNLGGASGTPEYEIVADECSKNSDCDENDKCVVRQQNVFGECIGFDPEPTVIEWARVCEPGCTEDSDCVEGQVCLCGAEIGRCAPISFVHGCASDADCDDGYHCLMNANASFACQLPGDECHSTVMCEANEQCVFDLQADARMCQPYFDGGC